MIAVPMYIDHITRSQLIEGQAGLSDFRVRMEQYYQDNRKYDGGTGPGGCGAAAPALTNYFQFDCRPTGQTYLATATGKATSRTNGFVYTIDQTNARATTGSPTGWGTSGICWISRKGSC
jgi:type IV pilus assembly protein PilE